jgi:integrase
LILKDCQSQQLREFTSDSQLLEIWLHGRSKHTQRAYRADVEHFLAWARKPFLQVTLGDLQQFADSLGELAPASRYRTLSAIKSLLAFAHRTGYLPYDVGRALRLPAVRSRLAERILPEAELHRVLSLETNPRNRAILTLLYASGMRVSELCGLCWRDLQPNSDGGQVTVLGKGGVTRAVRIPASVWKLVSGLRGATAEPGDPVSRPAPIRSGGMTTSLPHAEIRYIRGRIQRHRQIPPPSPRRLPYSARRLRVDTNQQNPYL